MKRYFFLSAIFALVFTASKAQQSYYRTSMINNPENTTRFAVYPNPAQGAATLQINGLQAPYTVKVFNSAGAPVYQSRHSSSVQLPIMKWQTGLYFISVSNDANELLYQEKLMVKSQ